MVVSDDATPSDCGGTEEWEAVVGGGKVCTDHYHAM